MTETIAEIGWNFMGDMNLAKQMIVLAKDSGADYAKFQTWSVSNLKSGPWDKDGRREIYEKAELTEEKHQILNDYCNEIGIKFLTSCFSSKSINIISKFSKEVKIPSTEIANLDLLRRISENFQSVFLSTGAATSSEINQAVEILRNNKLTILHCVCSYPCDMRNANLKKIDDLKQYGFPVGYSGHCLGIWDAIASLEYNVTLIEKHFTIDNELPGRDNKFALLPEEFKKLTSYIKNRNLMNTSHTQEVLTCEEEMRNVYRGRWDN